MVTLNALQIRLYRFSLPLKRPFRVGKSTVRQREGILLTIQDAQGRLGMGEASPLPGLHAETLQQAERELKEFKTRFSGHNMPLAPSNDWQTELTLFLRDFKRYPSVGMAIESALIDLFMQQGRAAFKAFSAIDSIKVEVNALVYGNGDEIMAQTDRKLRQGYRSLKLKVGRQPLHSEIGVLKKWFGYLPPSIKIRLDANRSWSLKQACRLGELPAEAIEYVEEPLENPSELSLFFKRTAIPVAWDESLAEMNDSPSEPIEGLGAVVLKPTVLGGWRVAFRWGRWAAANGVKVVLSDTVSSGIGLWATARLAVALDSQTAHGLDTYQWLAEDLLDPPLSFENGKLTVPSSAEISKRMRWERLSEV